MDIRILVEEEYGYRHWIWDVKATSHEALNTYFSSVVEAEDFFVSGKPNKHFIGEWTEIDYETYKEEGMIQNWDAWAHIHMNEDSNIRFYNEPPVRNIQ